MRTKPVPLSEDLSGFIYDEIQLGRYESPSDVVRAALQLLQARDNKMEILRAALIEGERSGPSEPFDFDEFIEGKRRLARP